ncbi:protein diaphanous homolog 3-like [Spea bombifrons]|uniref:protein diaphanous homolog 3-like n=1 Tax=Spea bombifrons TaxID=233779 RepID=UPI00234A7A5E|nr:protein diaphanous homolog 3-like [Spea bombifrons]
MTSTKPPSPQQLSQEEILKIFNKVKKKELSIEEALELSGGDRKPEDVKSQNTDSENPSIAQQYNFTVYKHRYRWQKRILQIDFYTQMIFNIEKGNLKRKFPFAQVKSCHNNNGLRFLISFYGHHDYELEAACLEDKETIIRIMNFIIQRNGQVSPMRSYARRHAQSDVILDGMLEHLEHTCHGESWVKYLVKLRKDEFEFFRAQETLDPVRNSLNLSECRVSSSDDKDSPIFTLQGGGSSFTFRIPMNEQTRNPCQSLSMRDDWVSLLQEHCAQELASPLLSPGVKPFHMKGHEKEQQPPKQDSSTTYKMEDASKSTNDMKYERLIPYTTQQETLDPAANVPLSPTYLMISKPTPPPPLPPPHVRGKLPKTPQRAKAFHWDRVPQEKISKSMWAAQNQKRIDWQRILDHFQSQETGIPYENSDFTKQQNILLDNKIAHNFNIVLKSFHVDPTELTEKLLILHERDGGLKDKHLVNLRRYVPSPKDKNMYLSFKGSPSELHIVDRFMLEMCKIPDLCQRLDTIISVRELPAYMDDLQKLLSQKIKACDQLLKSQAFKGVLHYVLAIGNCLNENAGKEKAKGFRLASLIKMSQLVSREKKFTLLHALVEQILLQEPHLAKFPQELTEFEAVPGASVKGLNAEVEVLAKELEKIDQYQKTFKSKHSKGSISESQFLKDLKNVLINYGEESDKLAKRASELKKIYADVLHTFAEADEQDSQELFGWISTFLKEFQGALLQPGTENI